MENNLLFPSAAVLLDTSQDQSGTNLIYTFCHGLLA